jgi:hypothetical protein
VLLKLFAELRRSLVKDRSYPDGMVRPDCPPSDAGLFSLLRSPLPHPKSINYESVAWMAAAAQSAEYMVRHMMAARNLLDRMALLEYALEQCSIEGLVLEFGVYRGESLQQLARRAGQVVHGFDSFEGLPEDWTYYQKQGRFSLDGVEPRIAATNIELHKGWFDATLPAFLRSHEGPVRFLHIDCDLYSSTRIVLDQLAQRIVPGTIIVFDEYLNYPGWDQHEYRAFQEYVATFRIDYRYIGFASAHSSVAVRVE